YLAVWEVDGAAWGVRFDAGGRRLDAEPLRLSGTIGADASQFDVTAMPGGFFIAWTKSGSIYGATLTGSLPALPRKLTEHVPASPNEAVGELEPHVAFNGSMFLLAYASQISFLCVGPPCPSQTTWKLIRLDASGQPIATASRTLDAAP